MKKFAVFAFLTLFSYACAELRWCKVSDATLSVAGDGWVQYDDRNNTCLVCSPDSVKLLPTDQLQLYECCNYRIERVGSCLSIDENIPCSSAIKCDGIKQCADGGDEIGCGQCDQNNMFQCAVRDQFHYNLTVDACVPQDKVCDSEKDCIVGIDETNCQWHRGWCDGFLCGKPHERCIPHSQVCDGMKQCIDGADEMNCAFCHQQFQCHVFEKNTSGSSLTTTGECIGSFRVCDGLRDCDNGLDETNCFRWREWSSWSECQPPDVCMRSRSRACVSLIDSEEVDPIHCYGVEDYDEVPGLPSVENQTLICPICIPTNPLFIDPNVTPSIAGRPGAKPFNNEDPELGIRIIEVGFPTTSNEANIAGNNRAETTQTATTTTSTEHSRKTEIDSATTSSASTVTYESTEITVTNSTSATSNDVTTFNDVVSDTEIPQSMSTTDVDLPESSKHTAASSQSTTTKIIAKTPRQADPADNENENSNKIFTIRPRLLFNVTKTMEQTTDSAPEKQTSYLRLVIIIAGTAATAALLVLFICLGVCCCSERRGRTAKWKLPKRFYTGSSSGVPQMYKDVQINDVENVLDKYATSQDFTLTRTSPEATPGSHGDSGIEDAASTSSNHSARIHHPTSTLSSCSSSTPC